ncbi:MAG: HD domain-containing protein [Lachnospiraceae bacterium]|nr:HD domain-containing protein [Lachnospiraceae bacterium]
MEELKLANDILSNDKFKSIVAHIEELESDRIFCHHDMGHFLDVARIAVLMAEEEKITVRRDIVYAAALLHDIGRAIQYESGQAHEIAGVAIAQDILEECGCAKDDITLIVEAIRQHGNEAIKDNNDFSGLLYRADKASRKCYMCNAADRCHKAPEKRVSTVVY